MRVHPVALSILSYLSLFGRHQIDHRHLKKSDPDVGMLVVKVGPREGVPHQGHHEGALNVPSSLCCPPCRSSAAEASTRMGSERAFLGGLKGAVKVLSSHMSTTHCCPPCRGLQSNGFIALLTGISSGAASSIPSLIVFLQLVMASYHLSCRSWLSHRHGQWRHLIDFFSVLTVTTTILVGTSCSFSSPGR